MSARVCPVCGEPTPNRAERRLHESHHRRHPAPARRTELTGASESAAALGHVRQYRTAAVGQQSALTKLAEELASGHG